MPKTKSIIIKYTDPKTGGIWHITSHRKLTAAEIEKQIQFIISNSKTIELPKKDGKAALFKWPESL